MSDAPAPHAPRVAAIVLAAGRSARFATHAAPDAFKLTAPYRGRPLIRVTVERLLAAARFDTVVVVTGHRADEVREALAGMPIAFVDNARHANGLGTSIAAGVGAVARQADAVLVALGDQPLDDTGIVRALLDRYRAGGATIVRPVYAGTAGNPVLFDAAHFPALQRMDGDEGARRVVAAAGAAAAMVTFDVPPPPDYDTAAELGASHP